MDVIFMNYSSLTKSSFIGSLLVKLLVESNIQKELRRNIFDEALLEKS